MNASRFTFSLAALAMTLNIACTKEIKEKQGNLGQEAAPSDWQKAINDTLADISIGDAKIGQAVVYEDNVRLELGEIMPIRYIKHELKDIADDASSVTFTMLEDWVTMDLSGKKTDEKHGEFSIGFKKSSSAEELNSLAVKSESPLNQWLALRARDVRASAMGSATPTDCDGQDTTDEYGETYDCIRYFNLVSERRRVDPPDLVKAKPNCGGLADCLMPVRYLSYDEVKWREGKVVTKVNVNVEVAEEVPDLLYEMSGNNWMHTPPVLSFCQRGPYMLDGTLTKVTRCTVLTDYQ